MLSKKLMRAFRQVEQARPRSGLCEGVVIDLSREVLSITLAHDGVAELALPAGTMTLDMKLLPMFELLEPGDMVRFKAAKEHGRYALVFVEWANH